MNELTATAANAVEIVRTPEIVAAEIRALTASMLNNVIEIGRRLTEAKEMLPHGAFGDWVKEQTCYSLSTANNFMRLYQEFGEDQGNLFGTGAKSQTIGNLPYSKALALLALPAGEREEFAETPHTVDGQEKTVDEMTTRELKQAIRERDEARADREKMAADMKFANERIEGLNADLEAKAAEAEKARAEADRLTAELKALREKPVEVAVQEVPDKAAIDAAVKQAEYDARKKRRDLMEKLAKAKEAQQAAEAERDALRARLETAQEQVKKAGGNNVIAGDAEIAQFKLLFDGIQTDINKMIGLLMKVRLRDAEAAGKLAGIMSDFNEGRSEPNFEPPTLTEEERTMYEELIDRLRSRAKQLRHTGGHCSICAACMIEVADAITRLNGQLNSAMEDMGRLARNETEGCMVCAHLTERHECPEDSMLCDKCGNTACPCRCCHFYEKFVWRGAKEAGGGGD